MRRLLPLLALPLLLVPARASAHSGGDDDDDSDIEQKAEVGVSLEGYHSGTQLASGAGVNGGYLGMHGRLGRRVALGFGIDQGYGDDSSGYKRYDIAWNLPKLYVYLNPKSKTQFYVTTGLDMRVSHFEDGVDKSIPTGTPWGFFYFGTFVGGGIEHRLDKTMALRLETRWFMRGRTDNRTALDPTFSKDTSGQHGGVVTIGFTFF